MKHSSHPFGKERCLADARESAQTARQFRRSYLILAWSAIIGGSVFLLLAIGFMFNGVWLGLGVLPFGLLMFWQARGSFVDAKRSYDDFMQHRQGFLDLAKQWEQLESDLKTFDNE